VAVDSRDKRFSMIGLASATRVAFPNPDATIGEEDRVQYAYCYWMDLDAPSVDEFERGIYRWAAR
jgi:hypothetical protein